MALKNTLLATAAIPLIALMGLGQASATGMVRPTPVIAASPDVIAVQSDEEDLLKQQRQQQRQERREERRKQRNDQGAGNDAGGAQDNGGRKRQKQAEQDDSLQQQLESEPVKPRRQKRAEPAAEDVQPDNAGQTTVQEVEPVKPRRKQQNDAETQQAQPDDAGQAQQDDAEQVKPRRQRQNDTATGDEGPSDEEIRKALDERQSGERRKRNQQADETSGQDNGSIEEIETPRRKKNQQAEDADRSGEPENQERVKRRKAIAEDPSKTADTVELPVENGAAVLDSDKDADKGDNASRERRKRQREQVNEVRVPKSDEDAQAGFKGDKKRPVRLEPVLNQRGERFDNFNGYQGFDGRRVGDRDDNRVIINLDGRIVIRSGDDNRLARRDGIRYERLPEGRIREIVVRPDGTRIVTIRNRYGEIIRRSRIERNDQEIVIFFSPDLDRGRDRLYLRDPGADLPPMRLRVPVRDYIIDVSSDRDRDYEAFLDQPPVEPVERVYSVDEVKYSARIRDKMRRIDLDTITFETGSAEIPMDQANSLRRVGAAIKDLLDRDPGETFLIEGHTDAVGSDESNLVLSDERAESVAAILSDLFEIPAENLVTQGYGERYLKIETEGAERANRRVTIRRITPLVRPVASVD